MESIPQKRCTQCGEIKPLSAFHTALKHKDGHTYDCKACRRAYRLSRHPVTRPRKWKVRLNPGDSKSCNVCGEVKPVEQFRKEHRDYGDGYYNQCHECERAKGREWSKNRKEYRREYERKNRAHLYQLQHEWRKRNKDKYDAQRKRYYGSHKGRMYNRNSQAIRRSKTKQGDVTTAWLDQFLASQTRCFYCKKPFSSKRTKTIDHVIPLDKGGEHTMANLVVACQVCNSSKGNRIVMLL